MKVIKDYIHKKGCKKRFKELNDNEFFTFDEAYRAVKQNCRSRYQMEQSRKMNGIKK
ncbi:hypothetical protein [Vibrio crassostreae]|uniref:hypothetical protein n=1 Tax=Vibrio crassostreae TaxID=246167 RepID=UPI001B30FBFB|nr:hypothetical protein [Vibrio crassostreae]